MAEESSREELHDLIYDVDNVAVPSFPDINFLPQKYAVEYPPSSYKYTNTAYMYFLEDHRERILRDEKLKFDSQAQFKAYLQKMWDNLDSKAKKKYQAKADSDKKRFHMVLETINHDPPISKK